MSKISLAEKDLWEVNDAEGEKAFVKALSEWVIKHYGNVNVAQRLNILANSCE